MGDRLYLLIDSKTGVVKDHNTNFSESQVDALNAKLREKNKRTRWTDGEVKPFDLKAFDAPKEEIKNHE